MMNKGGGIGPDQQLRPCQTHSSMMRLGSAYLDVEFVVPPKVTMKLCGVTSTERDKPIRDADELEIACR